MRKINTGQFRRATRSTPREINRKIVLNLVREHQPLSRADLARRMHVGRGMITQLVEGLIQDGVLFEGAVANAPRGRKPTLLHVRTRDQFAIAVDVRFARTYVALTDLDGRQLALESFPTELDPDMLVAELSRHVTRLLDSHGISECEGIGIVVPGMIHRRTGQILNSPQLGWRGVEIREKLAAGTGLRVFIENAPIACALAHMWLPPFGGGEPDNFVYVTVSDGIGVGVVEDGEVFRGHGDTAGEFGHLPLSLDGPRCMCGLRGCWEAYTSNVATMARYFALDASVPEGRERLRMSGFTMEDLIARVRAGDARARGALEETAHYLGLGLAGIVTALSPARILVGGEITAAWDLIQDIVSQRMRERTLTAAAAATPVAAAPLQSESPRLRGATALLVARKFAAPKVA
ncbi:ROK family protein [Longimicrobium sp.]|uniref:ROK family transcriptional regulator n=1 Tax=Longimicrobium sp. TaxID=2029185 RepID=UPI002E31FE7B|nr:ROK family protein [Longimicrobium sp.]HEX6038534.1 ROK family protein [Longimicrobium sp.]